MKYALIAMLMLLCAAVYAEEKFIVDQKSMDYTDNILMDTPDLKLAVLFPIVLLAIVIIMVLIDFMAVGVCIGSLLALVVPTALGILPLHWTNIMSMVVLVAVLIYAVGR